MSEQATPQAPPSQPPPRGPGSGAIVAVLVTFALAIALGTAVGPRIWSGMKGTFESHEHAGSGSGQVQYYTCGMHPWVIVPKPGDCPICHMKLEPIDPDKYTGEMRINPVIVQNIGVRIQPVTTGPLVKTIRTVGTVVHNEEQTREINLKFGGWIEKLNVLYTGAHVHSGMALFEIYSPELITAQDEYLLARNNPQLRESSRQRLMNYGLTEQQIADLESRGTSSRTIPFYSPIRGHVIAKNVLEGQRVEPGMMLFRIADHSTIWVNVLVYEHQLPYVEKGMSAIMTLPYIPGQTFKGNVAFVQPHMDRQTRQLEVRLEFENPNLLLKPGMYANVELQSKLADERVLAPRSAIIDTGLRQVAFVSLGNGRFEPREVQVGVETEDGSVEIREGLKPGEMIVTSGQFLLDSESRIRDGLARMIRGDLAADQKSAVAVAGRSELNSLPDPAAAALKNVLDAYLAIGQKLAGDDYSGIADPARQIAAGIESLVGTSMPDDSSFWQRHEEAATARGKALELITAADLTRARLDYADLSVALARLIRATGVPPTFGKEVHQLHCPMYLEGQGGSTWLQLAGDVRNPFYGSKMIECFDKRQALPITGAEAAPTTQGAP